VRTAVTTDRALDLAALSDHYAALTIQAREALQGQGFAAADQVIEWSADLRYLGQAFEVRVPCAAAEVSRQWADSVVDAFHDAHNALYGYDFRGKADQQVEWVNLRVTGIGPIPRPEISEVASGTAESAAGSRRVHFAEWTSADLFDRSHLGAGDVVAGPAVIQEFGSTVPVFPGFRAVVDRFANVIITRFED
jgi:N-methylhydantoinase A